VFELERPAGEVDAFPGEAEDLPFPHPGVQRDRHHREEIRALRRLRLTGGQQARDLVLAQEAEPALRLSPQPDLRNLGDVAPLLREAEQVAEDGQLAVDRRRGHEPAEHGLLDDAVPLILRDPLRGEVDGRPPFP
jgi:hypothetical protein